MAFLDAKKTFDTVWHQGLFCKLHQYGLTNDLWFLLFYWYKHLSSSVRWNGNFSRQFPINQGVRQVALLSPLFYSIFINDFLVQLEIPNLGLFIDSIYCGVLVYADDIALIATSAEDLQTMINRCVSYGFLWRYSFNASKSVIMVRGESHRLRWHD